MCDGVWKSWLQFPQSSRFQKFRAQTSVSPVASEVGLYAGVIDACAHLESTLLAPRPPGNEPLLGRGSWLWSAFVVYESQVIFWWSSRAILSYTAQGKYSLITMHKASD